MTENDKIKVDVEVVEAKPMLYNTNAAASGTLNLTWDNPSANPMADIKAIQERFKQAGLAAHNAQIAVNGLTEAAKPKEFELAVQERLDMLEADLDALEQKVEDIDHEVKQMNIFGLMTQRVAIAGLLHICGAKPKDFDAITKLMMTMLPEKDMDQTSMEELFTAADEAVTKYYQDKQNG